MFSTSMSSLLAIVAALLLSTAESKRYRSHDQVTIVANTIGPFNNPTETYPFFSLPFCSGTGRQQPHKQDLGETLSGSHKVNTPYDLTFLDPVPWRSLCEEYLSTVELKQFKDAVEDDFFFEMLIDGLPVWGYVGEVVHEEFLLGRSIQGARVYLYPHLHFSIGFNNDQIVSANVTTDAKRRVDITDMTTGQEVVFSYTVEWVHMPELKFAHRMKRYADSTFLPTTFEIHWLSIINSFVLVLLLTAFLAIILMRILKKDFSKYMEIDEDELAEEETGWKMIHGDVFRNPDHLTLFVAFIGSGAQIFCTIFILLLCVLLGVFKATRRGALLTAAILIYALCGVCGGLVGGRLYKQLRGVDWVWNTVLTAAVFPAPLCLVFTWVNCVAWQSSSTAALPLTTIALITAIILFVHFPLTVVGSVVGRNITEEFRPPSRTNKVPREVPKVTSWYRQPLAQLFMSGFLPFSAIYIELHYIFASIWGHKIYTLFGILFLAFVMLVIVCSFITIALLYFQLAREDHRWWWASFFNGGATGLFVFAYSFYYFFHRSNMDGVLQLSFYFGYMAVVSYAFFVMLGFVGFFSAFTFVNYIYSAVKTD
mmetsp:Transcript_25518/g.56466  ORF Transcript_25518/g.56466 Transcript_25518/m.56466 type:complete len:595 (-) Transcript_25518:255-2039(-)